MGLGPPALDNNKERDGSMTQPPLGVEYAEKPRRMYDPEVERGKIHSWLFALGRALEFQRGEGSLQEIRLPSGYLGTEGGISYFLQILDKGKNTLVIFVPDGTEYYQLYILDGGGILEEIKRYQILLSTLETSKEQTGKISRQIEALRKSIAEIEAILDVESDIYPDFTMVVGDSEELTGTMPKMIKKINQWAQEGKIIILETKKTEKAKRPEEPEEWDEEKDAQWVEEWYAEGERARQSLQMGSGQRLEEDAPEDFPTILIEGWGLDETWKKKALFPPPEKQVGQPPGGVTPEA